MTSGECGGERVALKLPEIHPISDLAQDARGLVARAKERREPIVITQRGCDVAVLLPIELYREMQSHHVARIVSPRLVNRADASAFRMDVKRVENEESLTMPAHDALSFDAPAQVGRAL